MLAVVYRECGVRHTIDTQTSKPHPRMYRYMHCDVIPRLEGTAGYKSGAATIRSVVSKYIIDGPSIQVGAATAQGMTYFVFLLLAPASLLLLGKLPLTNVQYRNAMS